MPLNKTPLPPFLRFLRHSEKPRTSKDMLIEKKMVFIIIKSNCLLIESTFDFFFFIDTFSQKIGMGG